MSDPARPRATLGGTVLVICISPFGRPDAALALACSTAGAVGVVDLGPDVEAARATAAALPDGVGIRIRAGAPVAPSECAVVPTVVIVDDSRAVAEWKTTRVAVEVTSVEAARAAVDAGADLLVASGHEAAGPVGQLTSLVLLQALVATCDLPVYVRGGVGPHTAAGCLAAGAAGVVLDAQLALVAESSLDDADRRCLQGLDGSETRLAGTGRVLERGGRTLEAGPDAALAEPLARRFGTAGAVIGAVERGMRDGLESGRDLRPLAPNAALARAYGIRYPIFQGPMTRVSDTAPFAAAVAAAGAMPFLALSLLRGDQVRTLLAETEQHLGGRPWGVGILGFVPEELRNEQLDVIDEFSPSVALIAGGRPEQAKRFDSKGVPAFLHVPSPGLLDLFLAQGAHRFVFEGMECGGHVGPRSSLVLWEQQIERLLRYEHPDRLEVVFAGGIHDARSAAFVAAAAGELSARGARIGVLMGTAYLFTEEAVASGAVVEGYQRTAIECTSTSLLETAPGHATRCAPTPYVEWFEQERARLEGDGVDPREVWQQLEEMNVGRLRIAAKGIVRVDDELRVVDETSRQQDGMVMLGQVAALRDATCTMADLHDDVSRGSAEVLRNAEIPEPQLDDDIAIVGMACEFAGPGGLEGFWRTVLSGADRVREVSPERWDASRFFDPKSQDGLKTPSQWGAFLDDVTVDPLEFGIPPMSFASIEPVQLLALKVARDALADAGYADRDFSRERTAVVFGAEAGSELSAASSFRVLWQQYVGDVPPELDAVLPTPTEDSFPGMLTNVISGRIANRLDLGGPNYTVDAACASSLAAVDVALKELRSGTSDMVVCGAADLHNGIVDYLLFASAHALSPSGRCRTFDAGADGIALGEGVAAIVVKRLGDARRDGDRVYAVIKGVGASSDGRSLGLTAPRRLGQIRAMRRAYADADVDPGRVRLVEAHGTGTVVGDRTELESLSEVFGSGEAEPGAVTLGSVKSQIGHTKCAAGLAGLIKSVMAVREGVLPPTRNLETPNPAWDDQSAFRLSSRARPWLDGERLAGVSAFGFGGTNFHVVISAHEGAPTPPTVWPSELFLIRAEDPASLDEAVRTLLGVIEENRSLSLASLARTVAQSTGAAALAFVADDLSAVGEKLRAHLDGRNAPGVHASSGTPEAPGRIAFLFPGQGSQRVGMLDELFVYFPELRRHLAQAPEIRDLVYPAPAWDDITKLAQDDALRDTRAAQPALGLMGLAAAELLGRFGVQADVAGGHSYGELVALAYAGALDADSLLALSVGRADAILGAVGDEPGTMLAVSASAERLRPVVDETDAVVIANENAPDQTVLAGSADGIESFEALLKGLGIGSRRIPVACAFHSPLLAAAPGRFRDVLDGSTVSAPTLPVYSNGTAQPHPDDPDAIRDALSRHLVEPVRFVAEIEAMYADGVRVFVEAGPGSVLASLVRKILGDRPHLVVGVDGPQGMAALLDTLARLLLAGVPVDLDALWRDRDVPLLDLDACGLGPSTWLVDGHSARPARGSLPPHAMTPVTTPIVQAAVAAPGDGAADTVLVEYLRGMRELVERQQEVVLSYLGTAPRREPQVGSSSGPGDPLRNPQPVSAGDTTASHEVALDQPDTMDVRTLVLEVVSQRTGYPVEMLDLDLDVEADLSIDSIKRIEILGSVAARLGLLDGDDPAELSEELVSAKSLGAIVGLLEAVLTGRGAPEPDAARSAETTGSEPAHEDLPDRAPGRFAIRDVAGDAPAGDLTRLAGRSVTVVNGGAVGDALVRLLTDHGADARPAHDDESVSTDELCDLSHLELEPSVDAIKEIFDRLQCCLTSGATRRVVVGSAMGGAFGRAGDHAAPLGAGGTAGLVRTLAKEFPDVHVRAVDLDPRAEPVELARLLAVELVTDDAEPVVGYLDGERRVPRLDAVPPLSDTRLPLDQSSVVLITGGARGIAALIARRIAETYGCHFEIVGRTDPGAGPEADDQELADAADEAALRRLLIARGATTPAQIEREVRRILGAREVQDNLDAIRSSGATVRYHSVDVRDDAALGWVIDQIYADRGRIDGVIHAAGVIEDRLTPDKTMESFSRVFDTKASSAISLLGRLRSDVKFVCLFSSVSATFGNRGQVDYAAANDVLDHIAHAQSASGARVVSIAWGPWDGAGMVSPELAREYKRRGVALLDPDDGIAAFFHEIGEGREAHVVVMAGDPASLV